MVASIVITYKIIVASIVLVVSISAVLLVVHVIPTQTRLLLWRRWQWMVIHRGPGAGIAVDRASKRLLRLRLRRSRTPHFSLQVRTPLMSIPAGPTFKLTRALLIRSEANIVVAEVAVRRIARLQRHLMMRWAAHGTHLCLWLRTGDRSSSQHLWRAFSKVQMHFGIEIVVDIEIKQLGIRRNELLQSREHLLDESREICTREHKSQVNRSHCISQR